MRRADKVTASVSCASQADESLIYVDLLARDHKCRTAILVSPSTSLSVSLTERHQCDSAGVEGHD